jgi:hypothetical protein
MVKAAFFCVTLLSTYKSEEIYDPRCLIEGPTQPFNGVKGLENIFDVSSWVLLLCISFRNNNDGA